jgi:sialate O-acetylesterase
MKFWSFSLFAAAVAVAVPQCGADVTLGSPFQSHMILQRDAKVPVWGWADAGEEVTVSFQGQTKTAKPDEKGKWSVTLDPLKVGEAEKMTVKGKNEVGLDDVLVGEVWVCSGQSNMEWPITASIDPDLEAGAANFPKIRLLQIPNVPMGTPQEKCGGQWQVCSADSVRGFSAVGYFFGRQLHETLGVPVGLIASDWGGTPADTWTSPEGFAATPDLKPILDRAAGQLQQYEANKDKPGADGKKPADPRLNPHYPSSLYNGMIAPIAGYGIRGAIWYQGESNAGRAYQYRLLMPTMIQSWRTAWKQGDFPFYQVELANFMAPKTEPGDSAWAELREAQYIATTAIPNVGRACIIDIGAEKDIHPKDKQNVGKRLARLALNRDYGRKEIVAHGPQYKSSEFKDGKATIKFDTAGPKLISYYGQPLRGFAIAGEDKQWKWAEAKITGPDTIEVSSGDIKEPKAVRYNWADNPSGTLYNETYLPAYPFRTDDWPGVTINSK